MVRTVVLDGTLDAFRAHARALIGEGIPPESIKWRDPLRSPRTENAEPGLFGASDAPSPLPDSPSQLVQKVYAAGVRAAVLQNSQLLRQGLHALLAPVDQNVHS